MFRSIFVFLFPLIILICLTGQVDNSGIEYYGTSNVRIQKSEAKPSNQPQTQPPLSNGPLHTSTVAAPEQPMNNDFRLPVVEIGAHPSATSKPGPVYVPHPNVVVTSHSPSQSNTGSLPTTVSSIHPPITIVTQPPKEYDDTFAPNLPTKTPSQPSIAGGRRPGASTPQSLGQVTPSQVAGSHRPTHLPKPVFIPPAIGSNYPHGPLPPLLPKPKPERQPDYIWVTQPTPVYPNTHTTHASIVTRPPPLYVPTRIPPKQNGSLKLDFTCKEQTGFYAIRNECDTYIQCQQYIATKYTCPDGLHFNSAARWNEYPCAYPSQVKCNTGIENLNPRPTNLCPRQYGFFSMNDGDCSKYIMCQGGIATIMNCPAGLVFNSNKDTCDWQINVPECNPNVFKHFTCPEAPVDEYGYLSDVIYKYKYQNQCKLYIACQKGHPRLLSCEDGLAFDEISQSCIKADYVEGCSIATPYRG